LLLYNLAKIKYRTEVREMEKIEKDEPPPVIDCGDCIGEKPQKGNPVCAGCTLHKKWEMEQSEQGLAPTGCADCTGYACVMQVVQGLCDGTHCPEQIGIPCCMTCPVNGNMTKIAM
jgi:hypothetical protein